MDKDDFVAKKYESLQSKEVSRFLKTLDDILTDRAIAFRENIAKEIFSTEETYVKGLQNLVNVTQTYIMI